MARKRSAPVQMLIKFIKEAAMNEDWQFQCPPGEAEKWVQRMRVELFRFKEKIRARNQKPKEFKLILVSISNSEEYDLVTIRKGTNVVRQIEDDLDEVFAALTR